MKRVLLIAAALVWLSAGAYETTDTVVGEASSLRYHARFNHEQKQSDTFGIRWDMLDSANYRYIELACFGTPDELFGICDYRVEYGCVSDGKKINSQTHKSSGTKHNSKSKEISIRLTSDHSGSKAEIGFDQAFDTFAVKSSGKGYLQTFCSGKTSIVRHELYASLREPLERADFEDMEALTAYLRDSHDPIEGIWIYFDSSTKPLEARLGGLYTVAVTKSETSGYDIIYLEGASERNEDWPALRVKGHMNPTPEPDVFKLKWIQPDGTAIDHATAATIIDERLVLQFPFWNTTLRLTKKKI